MSYGDICITPDGASVGCVSVSVRVVPEIMRGGGSGGSLEATPNRKSGVSGLNPATPQPTVGCPGDGSIYLRVDRPTELLK